MERSPVDLADVLSFLRVVETGSVSRAAERLGVVKSIVSRRIARLEDGMGARLLTRTARGAQPTDAGSMFYARAAGILGQLEEAREAVTASATDIAGSIRVTAPVSFGTQYLAPIMAKFLAAHPRVELDVSFDDRRADLAGGGFDLAVRIGTLPDSSLIAKRLAPVRRVLVGAPSYLEARGEPRHPDDLARHDVLLYANTSSSELWRFRDGQRWVRPRVGGRLRADNGDLLREAAIAGLGLAVLPTFIASPALAGGALRILLPGFPMDEDGLYAVTPPGRAATARVRAFIGFLAERFGPEPHWDPCWSAERARAETV